MTHARVVLLGVLGLSLCGCKVDGFEPPEDTDMSSGTGDTSPPEEVAEAPVALCGMTPSPPGAVGRTVTFNGAPSYDPEGGPIVGYEWELLLAPDGNDAALSSRTGETTTLTPRVVGEHRVSLSVISELGIRSEEACVLVLHVEA